MAWNFGEAVERLAAALPEDKVALAHGDRNITYRELDAHASGIARALKKAGLDRGAHVGHYMRNSPAYLETFYGCAKAGMVHVNVNYRYKADELKYLLDTLDMRALVYDREFAGEVAALKDMGLDIGLFIEAEPGAPENEFAMGWDEAIGGPAQAGDFSDDDVIIIATGGTTGMPKGVMWRNEDMWSAMAVHDLRPTLAELSPPVPDDMAGHITNMTNYQVGPRYCPLNPLMHGAAFMTAIVLLARGATVITVPGERFDPLASLREAKRQKVELLGIVGDAFAYPLVEALDAHADEKLLEGIGSMVSSGAIWSTRNKERLLEHNPDMILVDSLGSSEVGGFAMNMATKDEKPQTAKFVIGPRTQVLDDDMQPIPPGSDELGMLAVAGPVPLGYYGDPEKSAKTFPTVDGIRYVMTGDMCSVDADGVIGFKGRGNAMINTGGEKVFVEEVEEALKSTPGIADALVVGLPHERFGQQVVAVVHTADGETIDEDVLRSKLKTRISDYKVPRRIIVTTEELRAPNGKANYPAAKRVAEAAG